MSHSKIVIASDVGGILDMVEHKKTGLIFKADDLESLRDLLKKIFDNPHQYKYLAKNAYRYVQDNRSWSTLLSRYVNEYLTILKV